MSAKVMQAALFGITLAVAGAAFAQPLDGRLKRIAETKSIAIAYRADAMPFSFADDKRQVDGFSIELCKRVVGSIERQLKLQGLKINWVPVTVQSRLDAVAKGRADMECGSTTMTLGRMKEVDFSSVIFVEGTGLLVRRESGVRSLADLAGKKIGVVGGTTNERAIHAQVKRRQLDTTVTAFKSRDEAFEALEQGKVDAFASDKLLLVGAAAKSKEPLSLLADQLSFEPYGIVLPRGDSAFRLAVNTGLAQVYAGDEIVEIYRRWFGQFGRPSAIVEAAFALGAIPE